MTEIIDQETFKHLVELAAFEFDQEEAEYLRGELNNQLNAVREMEAIPLDPDMDVTVHGITYSEHNRPDIRKDDWVPYEKPDGIVEGSPENEDGYFVVPDIPHEDLS